MTSKETFLNFVIETQNKPYFSTLYDLDMWREDRDRISEDLEVLDILKGKRVNVEMIKKYSKFEDYNLFRNDDRTLDKQEFIKLKEWLDNGKNSNA